VRWNLATCQTRNLTGALAARVLPASWFSRQAGQGTVVISVIAQVLPTGGCLRIADDACAAITLSDLILLNSGAVPQQLTDVPAALGSVADGTTPRADGNPGEKSCAVLSISR